MASARLQVFIGTKAQYIKTAPLLRLMDAKGVPYRLIDSGQHAELARTLRTELGVRAPDFVLGDGTDVTTIFGALTWSGRIAARLAGSRRKVRSEIFGGDGGICIVHGDTPTTLLSCLLARRAGLQVAHLEAGLRSNSIFHPFPEELIRLAVMRVSNVLFAPTPDAVANLERLRIKGRVVPLSANTSVEAVRYARESAAAPTGGPVVVTMHRVENVHRRERVLQFVDTVLRIAAERPVRFVVHGPTQHALDRLGLVPKLEAAGIDMRPLAPHGDFVAWLANAPFVVIDGGSIQEECAYLGVPTLVWRDKTERPHGVGRNVVVSHYDPAVVDAFLADPEAYRGAPELPEHSPSEQILDVLLEMLDAQK